MLPSDPRPLDPRRASVLVVGAGILGRTAAWRLAQRGHAVTLVDPALAPHAVIGQGATPAAPVGLNGSQAALGVLMARVFQRSSGRAWRLRQQSHALWDAWLAELEQRGHRLPRRRGVLLLAATPDELAHQERIAADRARLGIPMRRLDREELQALQPQLPGEPLGALLSPDDGQVDPGPLLEALLQEARGAGAAIAADAAVRLEALQAGWRLQLEAGTTLEAGWVVLCAGCAVGPLLADLGVQRPIEPVLGQALELELDPADRAGGECWPGAVVWRGINLIQRPPLEAAQAGEGWRLWLGATLELGQRASPQALEELRSLGGEAPPWLRQARVLRHWQGIRPRPVGRPAPLLETIAPGLLLASGHYRNGVLLAPASAEWVVERVEAGRGTP